ncbi:MAG TPA: hypothetical protein V6D47_05485 [Oscillatoriaceae cyanobacterium]
MIRRLLLTLALLAIATPAIADAMPSLPQRVRLERDAMTARFRGVATQYHLRVEQAMWLSTLLGSPGWNKRAAQLGVGAEVRRQLWQALNGLPHPNFGQLTPYNLLAPAHDRWGVSAQEAVKGWQRYGTLIERAAIAHRLDPAILGAYVWTESDFDTHQLTEDDGLCAVGLGSVQAQDHPELGSMAERIRRLQDDPALNLDLTAAEFATRWNPQDMFSTVMDVWYPAWRAGNHIPHLGDAFGYMQLFSNRYFLLLDLVGG